MLRGHPQDEPIMWQLQWEAPLEDQPLGAAAHSMERASSAPETGRCSGSCGKARPPPDK